MTLGLKEEVRARSGEGKGERNSKKREKRNAKSCPLHCEHEERRQREGPWCMADRYLVVGNGVNGLLGLDPHREVLQEEGVVS